MPSPSTVTTAEKRVFDLAMALTPEERLRVAEAILDATPHESREDIEAAWFEEACRRVDMLQRGEMLAHDGEQVLAAIEASLRTTREQR